jgi:hypothetical protein
VGERHHDHHHHVVVVGRQAEVPGAHYLVALHGRTPIVVCYYNGVVQHFVRVLV